MKFRLRMDRMKRTGIPACILIIFLIASCKQRQETKGPVLFESLDAQRTGLGFSNKLTATQDFNVFKYMYFYNGGGVGAADFNNDGRIDVFFAGNQVSNRLYPTEGGLKFKD